MKKCPPCQPISAHAALAASVFLLPGILPTDRKLLLDRETRTALLIAVEGSDAVPAVRSFLLTPSSTTVFFALLQAYPQYCSYQSLFRARSASTAAQNQQSWNWDKAFAVPPIRRALKTLLPTLRSLGLQVVSLRGQGYVLASAQEPGEHAQPHGGQKDTGRGSSAQATGTGGSSRGGWS